MRWPTQAAEACLAGRRFSRRASRSVFFLQLLESCGDFAAASQCAMNGKESAFFLFGAKGRDRIVDCSGGIDFFGVWLWL